MNSGDFPVQKAWKKCKKDCTVRSAKVACIAILPGGEAVITVNKRGSGRVSRYTFHAEELMYRKLKYGANTHQMTVVVMRFRKNGTIGCARPCEMCDQMLRKLGVNHVFYTTNSGLVERLW